MPDNTGKKQADTQFKFGQSGNPAGRPKGSRNKLSEAFLADLHKHWSKNGEDVLDEARKKDPVAYLRVVASVIPKDIQVRAFDGPLDELTDRQVDALIAAAEHIASLEGGTGKANGAHEPDRVH